MKKLGFSLLEVMLALLVAALVITPLSRLVMRAVTAISSRNAQLDHYIKLQSFLYESRLLDSTTTSFSREEIITPRKTIKYSRAAVNEKSSLNVPFLTKELVIVEDKDVAANLQDKLISFFAILPPPKQKGEKVQNQEGAEEKTKKTEKEEKESTE